MKRIISNLVYDTETARRIGGYIAPGYSRRDFNYLEEALYIKKTGEYFLYGFGGALTKYKKSVGQNEWSGGEEITPLSYDEARAWAEAHLDADDYLKHFEAKDDTSDTICQIRLNAQDKVILDRLRSDGRTISEVISDLLRSSDE